TFWTPLCTTLGGERKGYYRARPFRQTRQSAGYFRKPPGKRARPKTFGLCRRLRRVRRIAAQPSYQVYQGQRTRRDVQLSEAKTPQCTRRVMEEGAPGRARTLPGQQTKGGGRGRVSCGHRNGASGMCDQAQEARDSHEERVYRKDMPM